MKTTRTILTDKKVTRYGKSSQSHQQKLSQSFFNSIKQYNTISVTKTSQNPLTDDEKISSLTQKNQRLKSQINKIQQIFQKLNQQQKIKPQYGIKLPQIRNQVIDRQLQNAYKQIKIYEAQIDKLKKLQNQGSFAARITTSQKILKEKQQIKDKLKIELQKLKRSSKNLTKSLTDNRSKIILQEKAKKLNDELKMYEKKWAEQQKKRIFFEQTQKKKAQYGQKLQKQLTKSGVSYSEIEQISRSIFDDSANKVKQSNRQKDVIEDRTPQAYNSIVNELKLLKKVTVTNDKLLQKLQFEKDDYVEKNKQTLFKLQQTQKEIDFIEKQLAFLKKHIDPQKIKPNIKQPLNSSRVTYNSISVSDDTSIDPFASRSKSMLQHHFQYIQIGIVTKKSQKFNDRKILGKKSAKIIAVELYQNRMQLLGFKFTYQIKEDQKISGMLMQVKNDNQRYLQKKQLALPPNDYFVSVECFINPKNIIIGIILISQLGQVIKAGNFQGQKRFIQMNPKQYPACIYSCIVKEGIQLFGVEKVEPQSF